MSSQIKGKQHGEAECSQDQEKSERLLSTIPETIQRRKGDTVLKVPLLRPSVINVPIAICQRRSWI